MSEEQPFARDVAPHLDDLTTPRLRCRPLVPDDAPALFAYRSDRQTNRFQGWIPSDLDDVERFIAALPAEPGVSGTWYQLAVLCSGELIGDVGVHYKSADSVELGITLKRSAHGHGFAQEVCNAVFGWLDQHGFVWAHASVDPRNQGSVRMLERLGFQHQETTHRSYLLRGEWCDDATYRKALGEGR